LTLAKEGEIFGKEVVGRPERFYRIYEPFSRKGLVINQFTTNQQKGVTAMKKRNMLIGCFVLLMMIAALVACASTSKQEGAGEYVDDSVITTKVKSLLGADDFLKSFEISVETYKGIVQLSGFVDSQKAIDKAGEIARSVKGVKSVKNNLNVKK
jgi:hyperosmotically inducible protein